MRILLLTSCLLFCGAVSAQWNDPTKPSYGMEPSRTHFVGYERRDDAITYNPSKALFYKDLRGEWYMRTPEKVIKVAIPILWNSADKSELKELKYPALPENDMVTFTRTVDIPVSWRDRDIYIKIVGARGAVKLKVNDKEVGYAEDGSRAAEFDISRFVADGSNMLAIENTKWTTGSWLDANVEGAGITDGVYLYSQPKVHIADFVATATIDSLGKTGKLSLDIVVVNTYNGEETVTVYFDLMNTKGDIVRYNYRETILAGQGGRDTIRYTADVPLVNKWTPQSPIMYDLILRLRYNGRFIEYIPYKIGFIKKEEVVAKAKDWNFKGIALDDKTILAELAKIKKEGYNAIKCYAHPDRSRLYELCARSGIYVIDVINLDTSITGNSINRGGNLGNVPQWLNSFIDRSEGYGYIRNSSSLLKWELDKKAGVGYNIYRLENKIGKVLK